MKKKNLQAIDLIMEVIDQWEVPATSADLARASGFSTPSMASALKILTERELLFKTERDEKVFYLPVTKRKPCLIQRYICTKRVE